MLAVTRGEWDVIIYFLKEINERNTVTTRLKNNETRSRTD